MFEEGFDEFCAATREEQIGTAVGAFDFFDEDLDAVTYGVVFAVDLFASRHDAGGTTEIDADESLLDAGDGAGDDSADFVFKGGKNGIVFSFAKALDDDLFGSLSGNAAEIFDNILFFNGVTDLSLLVFDLVKWDFGRRVVSDAFFDDLARNEDIGFTSLGVKDGTDVHVAVAVVFAPSGSDSLFDNI